MKWGWLILLSCAVPQVQAQAPTTAAVPALPIEYFARGVDVDEMKISPDGTHIAFTTGEDASKFLVFVNLDERKVAAMVRAEDDVRINSFHWVSATRAIYSYNARLSGMTSFGGETLRAVNRDGTEHDVVYRSGSGNSVSSPTQIRKREPNRASPYFISALRGDSRQVLIAQTPWVERNRAWYLDRDVHPYLTLLNVHTGAQSNRGVVPLAQPRVIVDGNGIARFALGYDAEGNTAAIWRQDEKAEWVPLRLSGFRDDLIDPLRLTADQHGLYIIGMRSDEDFSALYKLDLSTHAIERVAGFSNAGVVEIITDFADKEVVGVTGYAAGQRIHQWLKPEDPVARLHGSLSGSFPGHEIKFLNSSDDGRRSLVFIQSDRSPGEYFLFDAQTKRVDMVRAARPDIDPRLMRPRESVTFAARDGLPLHGYLTRPASPGLQRMVVLPHDGPINTRNAWQFDAAAQLLANRGYAVLQVNYRGSSGYGVKFEAAGYEKWGTAIQDDITDATRWVIDQKIADPNRICIFGTRFGGYSALMGAAREPKLYRCAIGNVGLYDLAAWYESDSVVGSGRNYLARTMGSDAAVLREQSPVHHAARVEAAVLLIHRQGDNIDRMKQTDAMHAQLTKANKNVELFKPSALRGAELDRAIFERVLSFLDAQLK